MAKKTNRKLEYFLDISKYVISRILVYVIINSIETISVIS